MTRLPERVDVAIVGAGTAGAAAAALCARRGLRVLCVDRRAPDDAGARWVNGVPGWAFDRAGLDRPRGDELRGEGETFHMVAGYGPHRLAITDHGVLEVDMRHLVARLQSMAREAGAVITGGIEVRGWRDGRFVTTAGVVDADVAVDASGLAGARLLDQPDVAPEHVCAAAQYVLRCADRGGAEAFFAAHDTPLGETLCFTGVAGGYSIINVRSDGDTVSILTGSIPALGHPSGKALVDGFVAEHAWIGAPVFGGARGIPLRRPLDRLADDRTALLGDAGCQVFPAHGSGIGPGLVAAAMLAEALAGGGGPRRYAVAWQRVWGGLLASYDLFRRFSQSLELRDIERMIERGLLDPELARDGMAQRMPRPTPAMVPDKLRALAAEPAIAARMAGVVARMAAARALYAAYPSTQPGLARWSRLVAALFGDEPDRCQS